MKAYGCEQRESYLVWSVSLRGVEHRPTFLVGVFGRIVKASVSHGRSMTVSRRVLGVLLVLEVVVQGDTCRAQAGEASASESWRIWVGGPIWTHRKW